MALGMALGMALRLTPRLGPWLGTTMRIKVIETMRTITTSRRTVRAVTLQRLKSVVTLVLNVRVVGKGRKRLVEINFALTLSLIGSTIRHHRVAITHDDMRDIVWTSVG